MPIRRVFGTTVFLVRETVDMPRPGEMRAAHFHVKVLDPAWRYLYGPLARGVMRLAALLNQLQFLTIRRYLTLVFATLVSCFWWWRHGADLRSSIAQAVQMLLVLAVAPLVLGVTRKVKARLLRRIGPPLWQPYIDLWKLAAQGGRCSRHNASWLYRAAPYVIFATTWVGAALVPTYATNLMFSWSADLIAIVALLATGRFALALAGMDVGTRVRRHRLVARNDDRIAGRARDAAGGVHAWR